MRALLALSRAIDALSEGVGRIIVWLVLVVSLLSAGNALMRYAFRYSSNAYLGPSGTSSASSSSWAAPTPSSTTPTCALTSFTGASPRGPRPGLTWWAPSSSSSP